MYRYFITIFMPNVQLSSIFPIPPVQTFTIRTRYATATESNRPHFLHVPKCIRKFHSDIFPQEVLLCGTDYRVRASLKIKNRQSIQGSMGYLFFCCVLCRLWDPMLLHKRISMTISFSHLFYYKRVVAAWILRGSKNNDITGTHIARWLSNPPWVVLTGR